MAAVGAAFYWKRVLRSRARASGWRKKCGRQGRGAGHTGEKASDGKALDPDIKQATDRGIGRRVSNTLIGNGRREEMVCSIKAEALASGKVAKLILANRNGGASEQIADVHI